MPACRRCQDARKGGRKTQCLKMQCNSQVDTTEQALEVLAAEPVPGAKAAGVMIGRAAWKRPWDCFSDADRAVFGADVNAAVSRRQVDTGAFKLPKFCQHALGVSNCLFGVLVFCGQRRPWLSLSCAAVMQALQQYAEFADTQLGRWHTRPDGSFCPNVRALTHPLLQLFYGEKVGSKACDRRELSSHGCVTVTHEDPAERGAWFTPEFSKPCTESATGRLEVEGCSGCRAAAHDHRLPAAGGDAAIAPRRGELPCPVNKHPLGAVHYVSMQT